MFRRGRMRKGRLQGAGSTWVTPPPYTGPDPDDLELWWDADEPLLSKEGNEIVFTPAGAPAFVTREGRTAMLIASGDSYAATPGWADLANGDSRTIYVMAESPTGETSFHYLAKSGSADQQVAGMSVGSGALAQAIASGDPGQTTDYKTGWVDATRGLISTELNLTGPSAWNVEAGIDGAQSGSANTGTATLPTSFPTLTLGSAFGAVDWYLWEVFVFRRSFNAAFATWANARF